MVGRTIKHGMYGTRLYRIWNNMHSRCRCRSTINYSDYGGSGINVCDDWQTFDGFLAWAVSSGYQEHLGLDRRNPERGYSPDNCRWATRRQQSANRRKARGQRHSQYKGVTLEMRPGYRKRWIAAGSRHKTCVFIGMFADEVEAAKAYDSWAISEYGEFAMLNFPKGTQGD